MERISEKDKNQIGKMRPGSIFTSSRDDGLRYVDKDGAEAWMVPNSRYYASELILRGQAVSIAQLDDLNDVKKHDKYPYVKITDPDLDTTVVGVACNYAEPGDIVHVQNHGKFSYYTTNSSFYTDPNSRRKHKEVFLNASAGGDWHISKVRGQAIYIKKVVEDPDAFETGHDTKDEIQSTDNKNNFTYDIDDSIYNVKNTIQLGYLVDAPTVQADDEDQIVTIELNITGDTRGPIDNTSFLMTLGEDIKFSYNKNTNIQEQGPDYNIGIFDELKVVSVAGEDAHVASFSVFTRTQVQKEDLKNTIPKNAFIAVRKLDGPTIFTPIFDSLNFNDLVNANDKGYVSLSKSFAANIVPRTPPEGDGAKKEFQSTPITEMPGIETAVPTIQQYSYTDDTKQILIANDPVNVINPTSVANIIKQSLDILTYASANTKSEPMEWKPSNINSVGNDGKIITAGIIDGYYDVYVSKELLQYITIKQRKHGQSAPKGSAILADVRDGNRLNVVGVVISNQEGLHKKGETIRVMKMGRITTKGEVLVGTQFYLGLNGRITTRQQYWYDYNVPIGIAESPHYFIVDCHLPQKDYDGAFPLGFIKPSPYGAAEKGFVLMDGYTVLNKKDWPELYEALKQWYGEDLLKPSNRNTEVAPLLKELRQSFLNSTRDVLDEYDMSSVGTIKERVDAVENTVDSLEKDFKQHEEVHTLTDEDITNTFKETNDSITALDTTLREKIEDDTQTVKDYAYEGIKQVQQVLDEKVRPSMQDLKEKQATTHNTVVVLQKNVTQNTEEIENAVAQVKDNNNQLNKLDQEIKAKADKTIVESLRANLESLKDSVDVLKVEDLKQLQQTIQNIQENLTTYTRKETTDALVEKLQQVEQDIKAILTMIDVSGGSDSDDSEGIGD